jgi:GNAT superfamily N-acetyltransferase
MNMGVSQVMDIQEYQRENYTISTDPARLDFEVVHHLLSTHSYWAVGRTMETIRKAAENSLNFGVYCGTQQVGYARVVTDYATFAWLCDVIVHPEQRAAGLGKWLVTCVIDHPDLKHIRRIMLATSDAHDLYRKYGEFTPLHNPERWMERFNPEG